MKNILFITLGLRDIELVYKLPPNNNGSLIRTIVENENLSILQKDNLKLFSIKGISEKEPREFKEIKDKEFVGICFPMIEKTLNYFISKKINIDELYLISTYRDHILPRLEEVRKLLEEKRLNDISAYIKNVLIKHINKDKTSLFSDVIVKHFNNFSQLLKFEIKKLNEIKLGESYSGFASLSKEIIEKHLEKQEIDKIFDILSRFDINNESFFYPALYQHLKQLDFFRGITTLKDGKIYLSTSGGMPLLQRNLQHILNASISSYNATIENIYMSEKEDVAFSSNNYNYYKLFDSLKEIKSEVLKLNFSFAKNLLNKTVESYNLNSTEHNNKIIKNITSLFNVEENDVFIKLYSFLLSSIYNKDYENLLVRLISLQELVFKRVILNLVEINREELEYNNEEKKDGILFTKDEVPIPFSSDWEILTRIHKKNLGKSDAYRLFFNLCYQLEKKINGSIKISYDNNFYKIKAKRNLIIHEGSSQIDEEFVSLVNNFLGIGQIINKLDDSLAVNDYKKIQALENTLLEGAKNQNFFYKIAECYDKTMIANLKLAKRENSFKIIEAIDELSIN